MESFFANPFGPMQKQDETNQLIDLYFNRCFTTSVQVGQIRTGLGISGMEKVDQRQQHFAYLKLLRIYRKRVGE